MNNFTPSGELENPYVKAKQVWDDRMGIAKEQARRWQIFAFLGLGLSIIMAIGLIYVGSQAKTIPFIIEIDKTGQVRGVGSADSQNYQPNEAVLAYFLQRFISNVRSLSKDPVVVRKNWTEAYNALSLGAANMMEARLKEHNPLRDVGKRSRTVEINSLLRISNNSFQAEWVENEYNNVGTVLEVSHYRGIFNVLLQEPKNESSIRKNPLGIFIDHFSWQKI